ncbi:hypothetical protein VroAM7_16720 [Vibrio rotiferianus]|uniref:Uncharacterized protein n=1 Tax=Vibrio rotiferianus TaxID=190895 RepID=A0A510I5Y1_9VIBR|nr:hypothetical protein [Vibrio rotiferianus]BBL89019.1 hypothetical protein VroAM7_16720 [Vibrio rotiferianus]
MEEFKLALFLTLTGSAIGTSTALFVAFWRTRYTVKSQDLSKRIELLCDSISKLEELSCQFWNGDEKVSQHYILGYKEKISLSVEYLENEYTRFPKGAVNVALKEFFVACTGGDFESQVRKVNPQAQRSVLITGETLQVELLKIRNSLY